MVSTPLIFIDMKKLRIKPDLNGITQIWTLEEKKGFKWYKLMSHPELDIVKNMKDHLLQLPNIYTLKNNTPKTPLRSRPSNWKLNPKAKFLTIKRSDLPESLKEL
jgi:hypothetical protein